MRTDWGFYWFLTVISMSRLRLNICSVTFWAQRELWEQWGARMRHLRYLHHSSCPLLRLRYYRLKICEPGPMLLRSHKSSQQLCEKTVIYNSTSHLWLSVWPKLRINGFWRVESRTMCKVTRTIAARLSQTHISSEGCVKEFQKKCKKKKIKEMHTYF